MKHRPVRKTITFRGITVTPENGWIHCPCGTDFTGADHYATVFV